MKMIDETSGKIDEAMIFYNPTTSMAMNELIESMPEARIYIPYGYTSEDLEELVKTNNPTSDPANQDIAMKFLKICASYREFMLFFNVNEQSLRDELKLWGDAISGKKPPKGKSVLIPPIPYKDVSEIYSLFRKDPVFREFVYRWLGFNNAWHSKTKASIKDIQELDKYGNVVTFPVNDLIGVFARDMIIPAEDNDRKMLIQGKVHGVYGTKNYGYRTHLGETGIVDNRFWKGRYDIVPAADIKLVKYEGGDLIAARDTLFVGQDTWLANLDAGLKPEVIEDELRRISGRKKIVVVGEDTGLGFPAAHLDMWFAAFDDDSVVIGDIKPVIKYLQDTKQARSSHYDGYKKKQPFLDRASERMRASGYEVSRVPLYMEFQTGGYEERSVSVPMRSFANQNRNGNESIIATFGVPELDDPGYEVYARHNIGVRELRGCGSLSLFLGGEQIYGNFDTGGARCLINVLSRK